MKKIIGWILLVLGILVIFWGIWDSYKIFNNKMSVPQIFEMPESQQKEQPSVTGGKIEEQIQQIVGEQFSKMFPPETTIKLLNLFSWSIFMFILIYAGGKISSIGIKLLS